MVCWEGSVKFWIHTRRWESTKSTKVGLTFECSPNFPSVSTINIAFLRPCDQALSGAVLRRQCVQQQKMTCKQRSDLVKQAILTNNSTVFLLHSIHSFVCYRLFSPCSLTLKNDSPSLAALRERKAY
jgi:hypothetical protein